MIRWRPTADTERWILRVSCQIYNEDSDIDRLAGFSSLEVSSDDTTIYARSRGEGPPICLLHGFPQTHVMWRRIAPALARQFTVVCPDLRGYGRSGVAVSSPDHEPYSKRAMARDVVNVMASLGFSRFSVAGHDRGGRVAYRLALDHPEHVERLAVLEDRKSTRLNSSHVKISYAVFCLKKKK